MADLTAALASCDLTVRAWFGVQVLTDVAADDDDIPDAEALHALLGNEERAGRSEPYRKSAALLHVFAQPGRGKIHNLRPIR